MDYQDIKKANEGIKTTNIKGKEYAEVNQRINAFRKVFPDGFIITEMIKDADGVCMFRASVGYYKDGGEPVTLGTGTAFEVEGSNLVNSTSHVENAETSAVGRGLGMCGFGIDTSVASFEEVANAINRQSAPRKIQGRATEKQLNALRKLYTTEELVAICDDLNMLTLDEIGKAEASELISMAKGE